MTLGDATTRASASPSRRRLTARGAFSFARLPQGRYRVIASKQGYTEPASSDPQAEPANSSRLDRQSTSLRTRRCWMSRSSSTALRASPVASFVRTAALRRTCGPGGSSRSHRTRTIARGADDESVRRTLRDHGASAWRVSRWRNERGDADAGETFDAQRRRRGRSATRPSRGCPSHWSWYPGVADARAGKRRHGSRRRQRRRHRHLADAGAAIQCLGTRVLAGRRVGRRTSPSTTAIPPARVPASGSSRIPAGSSRLSGIAPGAADDARARGYRSRDCSWASRRLR